MNKVFKAVINNLIPAVCVGGSALIWCKFSQADVWTYVAVIAIAVTAGQFVLNKLIPAYRKLYTTFLSILGVFLVTYMNFLPKKAVVAMALVMGIWAMVIFVAMKCQNQEAAKSNKSA